MPLEPGVVAVMVSGVVNTRLMFYSLIFGPYCKMHIVKNLTTQGARPNIMALDNSLTPIKCQVLNARKLASGERMNKTNTHSTISPTILFACVLIALN